MPKLDITKELNGPQLEAVTCLEGPVQIIAGAGSGKTRVITYRIAHMLEKKIPESSILALTFTNKAAREMESRVRTLSGKKLLGLTISTFHSFGAKILREEAEALGYRRNFSIYDEGDRTDLIKECLRDLKHSPESIDLYMLGQMFSKIKTGLMSWGEPDGSGAYADTSFKPLYDEYQRSLKIYNAFDFDDLLAEPIQLFKDKQHILEKYQKRYNYIMVDEFQDTSLIQYKLLKMLAIRLQAKPQIKQQQEKIKTSKANICVVGDDDQSIYSWRGASYENLKRFDRDFPGSKEIKLEQNYRSTTTILDAANNVISNNTNRKKKKLWTGGKSGRPIELYYPDNETEEARFIAERIKEMRLTENLAFNDFGVLLRTNSQISCIEEAFLAQNIPCRVSGGMSFFERREIKDILSYLKVIANPNDDISLLRIINTPRRGIGKTTIAQLSDIARKNKSCLWDSMNRLRLVREHGQENLFGRSGSELESFMLLIDEQREKIFGDYNTKLSKKVKAMVETINYWGYLVTEFSKEEKKARWKYNNINYLIEMMENWENDPDNEDTGLYAYLNRISLLTRTDNEDDDKGSKVNLMTIHASKGLEFPVVFIAGAENKIIPHEKNLEEASDFKKGSSNPMEEERRLFYVAITRAREKLFITSCIKRKRFKEILEQQPSPFLLEIPNNLIENYNGSDDDPEAAKIFFSKMMEQYE